MTKYDELWEPYKSGLKKTWNIKIKLLQKYTSTQVQNYKSTQVHTSSQLNNYTSKQVHKYTSI